MKTRKVRLCDPPNGRAQRRGMPRLQTKLDQNCLYKNLDLSTFNAHDRKFQRARVGNLSFFFVKRAGGPTLTRAGRARARARARAKYKPKHRKLDFFVG